MAPDKLLKLLALLLLSALTSSVAFADPSISADPATVAQAVAGLDLPLVPEGKELKDRPQKCQIYQSDSQPIGNRRPILFIHGGNGEDQPMFRWDKVIGRFNQDQGFVGKYKVYLLRYNSIDSLAATVPQSRQAIKQLYTAAGSKPITIVALSMGGNVAQEAMVDPAVDKAVSLVFAMATPFHGSPLFSADWFQYSLYKSNYFPVMRLLDSLDYRLYFKHHQNYEQDLKWDDVDSLIPRVGQFHSRLPLGPAGDLTLKRDDNRTLSRVNQEITCNKKKFVTYAGYLVNSYVLTDASGFHVSRLLSPFKHLATIVRAEFGTEQAALVVLNSEISKVRVEPHNPKLKGQAHVYGLNDGITPVSSALFLSPEVVKFHPVIHESDLTALCELLDVRRARVFRNINHVTFVDGTPPHNGCQLVKDELHPDEKPKHIFDWMLAELMEEVGPSNGPDSSSGESLSAAGK